MSNTDKWTSTIVSCSALEVDVNDHEAGEELEPILACRKYLLEAGSDPNIPIIYNSQPSGSPFESSLDIAVPVRLIT